MKTLHRDERVSRVFGRSDDDVRHDGAVELVVLLAIHFVVLDCKANTTSKRENDDNYPDHRKHEAGDPIIKSSYVSRVSLSKVSRRVSSQRLNSLTLKVLCSARVFREVKVKVNCEPASS